MRRCSSSEAKGLTSMAIKNTEKVADGLRESLTHFDKGEA